MKKIIIPLITLLIAMLSVQLPAAEKYYKWVDKEGVTHYGTDKPGDGDAKEVRVYNSPSSSQGREMQELEEQRKARQRAREQQAQQEQEQERAEENPEQASDEYCEQHRKNLKTLMDTPTVRQENPDTGEMQVLDEEQREAAIEKTKEALEKCND